MLKKVNLWQAVRTHYLQRYRKSCLASVGRCISSDTDGMVVIYETVKYLI